MYPDDLTTAQEQCLRDQVIDETQPGPVLHDFRVLLEFLQPEGVAVGGKHNLLPLKYIGELDSRLSHPLNLMLKRPRLRSHPYLQGLNLLLRASGLGRVEGTGEKTRLVLDPDMNAQWNRLNPTEQYFNLMEAWFRFGRAEMVGERQSNWETLLGSCLQAWQLLPQAGKRFDLKKPRYVRLAGIGGAYYLLALMDLFGLVQVDQPPPTVKTWLPTRIRHVPFGDAVFTLLVDAVLDTILEDPDSEEEDEDQAEQEPRGPRLGIWQSLFQPYFPEWEQNLCFPEPELREGEFIFRVSLGEIWRLIAIPSDATLDDLVDIILDSVDFDSDHLYEFTFRNRMGAQVNAVHPQMDEGPWTDEILVGELPLEPGQTMQLLYDFGDSWQFTIKLERIDPPRARSKGPRILETHGDSPDQYPAWDG